jgi:hypothetical protein
MATYTFSLSEAVAVCPQNYRGATFMWDFTALAAAKAITLAVSDYIHTEIIDLQSLGISAIEEIFWAKKTPAVNNADLVALYGYITPSVPSSWLPLHTSTVGGNTVCYSVAANNSTWVRGTPTPYVQGRLQIVTSVPPTIQGALYIGART